eukprot:3560056-Prymnesium_polylepis.1
MHERCRIRSTVVRLKCEDGVRFDHGFEFEEILSSGARCRCRGAGPLRAPHILHHCTERN